MKKLIQLTIVTLFVFSFNAESGTFNLNGVSSTNELFLDQNNYFEKHINHFFGGLQGFYFWNGSVAKQVIAGLSGPPNDIVQIDKNVHMATACRAHSCTEKGAYITDGRHELFALIGYMCPAENGKVEYKYDGCLSIFYNNRHAEKELSPWLIRWKERIVPGAPVYTVQVHR
ncbi:TPA: hypothetical protein ACJGSF_005552 [Salmonella enterica subsp. enterica serovar Muenchen]